MAGDSGEIPKLTGMSKYFNSYTQTGRVNVVLATYGSIFLIYLFNKLRPSKPKTEGGK